MNPESAKFILQSFRPGEADQSDDQFSEALQACKDNPELMKWFEQHQDNCRALQAKLNEYPVPDDLKSRILAVKTQPPQKALNLFSLRNALALAASILLLFSVSFFWLNRFVPGSETHFAAYQKDMGNFLDRFFILHFQSKDLNDIKDYLKTQHQVVDYEIPAELAKHPGIGCTTIDWHQSKVALICFTADNEIVHLFILPKGDLPDPPASSEIQYASLDRWTTASWSEGDKTYLATTTGSRDYLKKYL